MKQSSRVAKALLAAAVPLLAIVVLYPAVRGGWRLVQVSAGEQPPAPQLACQPLPTSDVVRGIGLDPSLGIRIMGMGAPTQTYWPCPTPEAGSPDPCWNYGDSWR